MINLGLGLSLLALGYLTIWWLPLALYAEFATYLGIKASNSLVEIPGNVARGFLFVIAPVIYDVDWSEIFDRVKRRNSNWTN